MKKLFIAVAALALVAITAPAFIGQAKADGWEHARRHHVWVVRVERPENPWCKLPKASNNSYAADASWADFYNCWGEHKWWWAHHHEWAWHHEWSWGWGWGWHHHHHWWWHHHHHWHWWHHHHHHHG